MIMMKRLIYITLILTVQACSPFGSYMATHKKHYWECDYMQINEDSTYAVFGGIEWFVRRSSGTWKPIQGKKNHMSFKSSLSDYSHIPIFVRESHNENFGTTIIFTQGKQFYNCEFNELLVNGTPFKIDADTILDLHTKKTYKQKLIKAIKCTENNWHADSKSDWYLYRYVQRII